MTRSIRFVSLEDFGGADSSHKLFKGWGWEATNDPDAADIIVFNGGTDVGSEMYGEKSIGHGVPQIASYRDHTEKEIFDTYNGKKLLVGICRGAQFLNVMNGGKLWQHVNNHQTSHEMMDLRTGKVVNVTSTHHQMMRPNLEIGQIIGIARESTEKFADGEERFQEKKSNFHEIDQYAGFTGTDIQQAFVELNTDVEIVWYSNTNCLCIQGHPEYYPDSQFTKYAKDLILDMLIVTRTEA